MRIIQVSRGLFRVPPQKMGGPETALYNLALQSARIGHSVTILDKKYSDEDPTVEYRDGIKIVRLKTRQFQLNRLKKLNKTVSFLVFELNTVLFSYRVSRYLEKHKHEYDVIHFHSTMLGAILVFLNRYQRKIMFYTCHLNTWVLIKKPLGWLARTAMKFDIYLMKRIKGVIALNNPAKEIFITRGKVLYNNAAVINNGVDTEQFNTNIDTGNIQSKYNLLNKRVILFVGRLCESKGIFYMLKAADILVNKLKYKNAVFIIVGNTFLDDVDEPVTSHKIIKFTEDHGLIPNILLADSLPKEELRALYAFCDVFILPSLAEGDPAVTLEAMACGKPVIATKVGGIPEQIQNGWNGLIIDTRDENQLANKLQFLLDNPSDMERMGKNAREYMEKQRTWRTVTEKYLEFYQH
jgi:glycosyltransferase involved in cell wall biosynthesis